MSLLTNTNSVEAKKIRYIKSNGTAVKPTGSICGKNSAWYVRAYLGANITIKGSNGSYSPSRAYFKAEGLNKKYKLRIKTGTTPNYMAHSRKYGGNKPTSIRYKVFARYTPTKIYYNTVTFKGPKSFC
ncbi:hypothetical protein KC939_02400 [Candidatus Saccharibacteria bacterium]|nr:hypothetical protein [Candidatus Saccharibacteria bacterium]